MSNPDPMTKSARAASAPGQQLPLQLAQNLPLVHRVLSADTSELANMTLTGGPRVTHTPTYEEFEQSLTDASQEGVEQNIVLTMKRAFRDQLCEQMRNEPTIQPAKNLLVELHDQLRALIPSRNDLHGLLKDDTAQDAQSSNELIQLLALAARALSMLESESRAESTLAWIAIYRARDAARDENPEYFLVTSLLYLLRKAEMCAKDKQDFYFSHLYAPQLLQMGPQIERSAFEARFGKFSDPPSAAATRQWLQAVARMDGRDDKVASNETRHKNIKKGWVQGILFRPLKAETMPIPEVFYLDQNTFQKIRMIVRMSVSGSALALHACQAAIQSTDVLTTNLEPASPLDLRRTALVRAMGQGAQTGDYQNNVAESVIALARYWNPRIDTSHIESLRGRVAQVLDAKDPVINLLNQRMKDCFVELLVSTEVGAPAELRSGSSGNPALSRKATFLTRATALFCSKGMTFFASDLALAAWGALRIIEVVILVYDKPLLEPAYNNGA